MGTSQHGSMPPDLVRGQRRFQAWRELRKPADPIPLALLSADEPAKAEQDKLH
jgi:hypothetical protein